MVSYFLILFRIESMKGAHRDLKILGNFNLVWLILRHFGYFKS